MSNREEEIKTYCHQFKGNDWAYYLITQLEIEKGTDHNVAKIIDSNIKRAPLKSLVTYITKNFHEKYPKAVEKISLKPNPSKVELATDVIKFVELSIPRHNLQTPNKTQQRKGSEEVVIEINTDDETSNSYTDETGKKKNSDSEWEPSSEYDEKETSSDSDEQESSKDTTETQKENQSENEKEIRISVESESQNQSTPQIQENSEHEGKHRETSEIDQQEQSNNELEPSQENNTLWDTWIFEPKVHIKESENTLTQNRKNQERKKSFSYWGEEDQDDDLQWEEAINEAYNKLHNEEKIKYQTEWNMVENNVSNINPDETYSYEMYESCEENESIREIARDLHNITKEPLDEDAPEAYKEIIEITKKYSEQLDQRVSKQDSYGKKEETTSSNPSQPPRNPVPKTNLIPIETTKAATLEPPENTQDDKLNEILQGNDPAPTNENVQSKDQTNNKTNTESNKTTTENRTDKNTEISSHEVTQEPQVHNNDKPQPPNEQTTEVINHDNETNPKNTNKTNRKKPHRLTHRTKEQIINQYEKLEKEKEKALEQLKEKKNRIYELESEMNKIVESNKKQKEEIQEAINKDESELLEQLVSKIVEKGKLSEQKEEISRKYETTKKNNQEKQNEIRKLRETLKEKDEWILELHNQKEKEISLRIKTDEINTLLYSENESLKLINTEVTKEHEKSKKDIENLKKIVKEISKNTNEGDSEILTTLQQENRILQTKLQETQRERDSWQILLNEAQKEIVELAEEKYDWLRPKTHEKETTDVATNDADMQIEREYIYKMEPIVYNNRNEIQAEGEWRAWYRESNNEHYERETGRDETTNPNPKDKNDRQENCPFYLRGMCKLGNFCKFNHTNTKDKTQTNSEIIMNETCRNYQRGFCKFGEFCKYRHIIKENEEKNREICRDYERGWCRFGNLCKYSHKVNRFKGNTHKPWNNNNRPGKIDYQNSSGSKYEAYYPETVKEYNYETNNPSHYNHRNNRQYNTNAYNETKEDQMKERFASQEQAQTKRCRYHEKGYCRNGEHCQFLHRKTCYFFNKNGQCRNGDFCNFIHRVENEQANQIVNQAPINRGRKSRY